MDRVRVSISGDGMGASIDIVPGSAATTDALQRAIAEAGVVHGLLHDVIADLGRRLADPAFVAQAEIARGVPVRPCRDGCVEPAFATALQPGRQDAAGTIDYHERDLLHGAAKGAVIAQLHAPVHGTAGKDVRGRDVQPAMPRACTCRFGNNVTAKPDGRVVANIDGVVHWVEHKLIDVVPLWRHKGDVDLKSGNLHVPGALVVQGNVHEGFVVEAGGDVAIEGELDAATLVSTGNVAIQQGVLGGSEVYCAGNLRLRHAINAVLQVGGALRAGDQLVHCRVHAQDIFAVDGRGHVVGGQLRARGSLCAKEAGTTAGSVTVLGAADLVEDGRNRLQQQLQQDRIERQASKQTLGGQDRGKGGSLGRQRAAVDDRAAQELVDLRRRQREALQSAVIAVSGAVHPGVVIRFGEHELPIRETLHNVRFRWNAERTTIEQEWK